MIAACLGRDRGHRLRSDWEQVKDDVMRKALWAKVTQHADVRETLLATKDAILVEHTANDSYWADGGDGSGQNMLGRLWMDVRAELTRDGPYDELAEPLLPPWLKYPEIPRDSIGWRMGYGEDYASQWDTWYRGLTAKGKQTYQAMYPEPEAWRSYYRSLTRSGQRGSSVGGTGRSTRMSQPDRTLPPTRAGSAKRCFPGTGRVYCLGAETTTMVAWIGRRAAGKRIHRSKNTARYYEREAQSMRDYLYLWHQPQSKRLIASGIEFRDLVPELVTTGGLVLLQHGYDEALYEFASGFEFVPADTLATLAADDTYGCGDFCWADIGRDVDLGGLSDQAIAELTFFGHARRTFGEVEIPGLSNRFLYDGHDDGWRVRLFYAGWEPVESMLRRLLLTVLPEERALGTVDRVRRGEGSFWCRGGSVIECEQTEGIDAVQQKYLPRLDRRGKPDRPYRESQRP